MKARVCRIGVTLVILVSVIASGASATTAGARSATAVAAPAPSSPAAVHPERTAHDTDATSTDTNLLLNGGFEAGTTDWSTTGQTTMSAETDTTAHDGSGYLEASSTAASGSVEQSVPDSLNQDASASFSIWVRAAAGQSPSGQAANVCLWAGNPLTVNACQSITLTSQWQEAEATVTVPASGTTGLLAQVYLPTGTIVDLDGGVVSQNLLQNGGFEAGITAWNTYGPTDNTGTITANVLTSAGGAHDGSGYLQTSQTGGTQGSFYQDNTSVSLSAGESVSASVWARLDPSSPLSGQSIGLCVWNLTAVNSSTPSDQTGDQTCTALYLTHQWQQVSATATMQVASSDVRTQVYTYGPGAMDFDSASLTPDMLTYGGFEGGTGGWNLLPTTGGTMDQADYTSGAARDGSSYYEFNSNTAGGSVYQDVTVSLATDTSATFSIWVRAAPNQTLSGQNVGICLWARNDYANACINDPLTNDQWQNLEVTETIPSPETVLRAQVYIPVGLNIDLDGAILGAPQAAATVIAPVAMGAPSISGSTAQGSTLTCSTGSWESGDASPTAYSYAWERNGTVITGATGSAYTTGTADAGDSISCVVSASNAAGQANAASASVGPIGASSSSSSSSSSSGPTSTSPSTSSPAPSTVTAQKRLNLDDLSLAIRASAPIVCSAKANKISVTLSSAARRATAKVKITSVGIYLGSGIKHTRKVIRTVHGRRRTVTVTSYTPNLTVKRLPASGTVSFTGRAATARVLRAVVSYRLTTTVRGHTTTANRRTTVTLTIKPC